MTDTSEIEARLEAAQAAYKSIAAHIHSNNPDWWARYHAALDTQLGLERELAAARGDEYAVPINFPVRWDTGAPQPHILASDADAYVIFHVRTVDPNWDGTYTTVVSPSDPAPGALGIVKFRGFESFRFGTPNDEVFNGHPLNGKGLDSYTAQEVINSRWIAEMQKINSVHSRYRPENWARQHHYIFWFHDNTFECVASGFQLEVITDSLSHAVHEIVEKLML